MAIADEVRIVQNWGPDGYKCDKVEEPEYSHFIDVPVIYAPDDPNAVEYIVQSGVVTVGEDKRKPTQTWIVKDGQIQKAEEDEPVRFEYLSGTTIEWDNELYDLPWIPIMEIQMGDDKTLSPFAELVAVERKRMMEDMMKHFPNARNM